MDLINLKHTSRYKRRQEKFQDILPIPEIQYNPREYFSLFSKSMLRLFKEILFHHGKRNVFCISQQWLAMRCGVTRQYLNRLLGEMESMGIIKMLYVHKQRSFYRLSSFFTGTVIASLSSLWRAWPLALLVSNTPIKSVNSKSRQLLNVNSFILNLSLASPTCLRDLQGARAHAREGIPPRSIESGAGLKRKEEVVIQQHGVRRMAFLPSQQRQLLNAISNEDSTEPLFSEAIQSIKSLNLTTFGKIKLLAFPAFVITKADEEVASEGKVKDPFGFFMATAMKICRSSGIQPDWKWVNAIKDKLNLPDQTPTLVAAPEERIPQKRTGYTKQQSSTRPAVADPDAHNMEILKEYNYPLYQQVMAQREARRLSQEPKKSAHEIEWERIRVEEPDRFTRLEKSAKSFREILGLNEDGTFKPGREPQSAVKTLLKVFS